MPLRVTQKELLNLASSQQLKKVMIDKMQKKRLIIKIWINLIQNRQIEKNSQKRLELSLWEKINKSDIDKFQKINKKLIKYFL